MPDTGQMSIHRLPGLEAWLRQEIAEAKALRQALHPMTSYRACPDIQSSPFVEAVPMDSEEQAVLAMLGSEDEQMMSDIASMQEQFELAESHIQALKQQQSLSQQELLSQIRQLRLRLANTDSEVASLRDREAGECADLAESVVSIDRSAASAREQLRAWQVQEQSAESERHARLQGLQESLDSLTQSLRGSSSSEEEQVLLQALPNLARRLAAR
eukprot:TRINITY_DN27460_c0_g2_i2.p1 TRINITY_DN27460_c0_g2~~TRINITY_DN27460_c0_g2_i2.p1  ORF type:complete len:215 (-),score=58.11 TRINITY_DN27460_c0_g2_i2:9-653(-)